MATWRWQEALPGTQLFPHHRRWDCRKEIISTLRALDDEDMERVYWHLGRASAFNAIMFDCGDPLAYRYAKRIEKLTAKAEAMLASGFL